MTFEWLLFSLRLLATTVLYTFLGLAFYLIWRSLESTQAAQSSEPAAIYQLRVVEAQAAPDFAAGESLPLQAETRLGRDAENTIVLHDAAASAQHARLHRKNGTWWLEDLDSRNGTMLNDLPLTKPTTLTEGDIIAIGGARFRFEVKVAK